MSDRLKLFNVVMVSVSFMLVFTAFNTMGNVQTVILEAAKNNASKGYVEGFTGSGYTSLAIVYLVFTFSNLIAPSVVALAGPRVAMLGGAACYALFIAQLLYPMDALLYGASAIVGVGAAIIWVAQGNYLTKNSDETTMARNSAIFWGISQSSQFFGNLIIYFQFLGLDDINATERNTVGTILLVVCLVGVALFLVLRPTPWADASDSAAVAGGSGPFKMLLEIWRTFFTRQMLLLCVTFIYTGLVLTFWSGVYGTSIGFTKHFGDSAKSYVGMHGIFNGVGEVIAGLLFGILGQYVSNRGRDPIVMLGFLCHMPAFFLIFINIPWQAPIEETSDSAYITSNAYVALLCSFLLGFGDACFNTQVYSIIGGLYKDNSAPAFGVFKLVQSATTSVYFFYARLVTLQWQLLILVVWCVAGTVAFCWTEWESTKRSFLERRRHGGGTGVSTSCAVDERADDEGGEKDAREEMS